MIKNLMSILILTLCLSHCTEFAILSSTAGVAASNNMFAKTYSGIDFLTIIQTEKDIKTHVYNHLTEQPSSEHSPSPPMGYGSGSSTEKDHSPHVD